LLTSCLKLVVRPALLRVLLSLACPYTGFPKFPSDLLEISLEPSPLTVLITSSKTMCLKTTEGSTYRVAGHPRKTICERRQRRADVDQEGIPDTPGRLSQCSPSEDISTGVQNFNTHLTPPVR
jgi:hypothetical protein